MITSLRYANLLQSKFCHYESLPPATGLGDVEKGCEAGHISTTLARRCDSFCTERDACCGAPTLALSWVGPTFIVNLDLLIIPIFGWDNCEDL